MEAAASSPRSRRALRDYRALLRSPLGHYVLCEGHLLWSLSRQVSGATLIDEIPSHGPRIVRDIFESCVRRAPSEPQDVVVDARRVRTVHPDVFPALMALVTERRDDFLRYSGRWAMVVSSEPTHALFAAFFALALGERVAWRVFTDLGEALAWVGRAPAEAEFIEALAEATAARGVVARLRAHLESLRRPEALAEVARALGTSSRTLQRELAAHGTSFRAEVRRARRRYVESLLAESELKVDAIARDAGFSSAGNLAKAFRAWTDMNPSAYRRVVAGTPPRDDRTV